jgi:hypothetical protein
MEEISWFGLFIGLLCWFKPADDRWNLCWVNTIVDLEVALLQSPQQIGDSKSSCARYLPDEFKSNAASRSIPLLHSILFYERELLSQAPSLKTAAFWLKILYHENCQNARPRPAKSDRSVSPRGEGAASWNSSETCSIALQRSVLQAEHRVVVCAVCLWTRRHRGRWSVRNAANRSPRH